MSARLRSLPRLTNAALISRARPAVLPLPHHTPLQVTRAASNMSLATLDVCHLHASWPMRQCQLTLLLGLTTPQSAHSVGNSVRSEGKEASDL